MVKNERLDFIKELPIKSSKVTDISDKGLQNLIKAFPSLSSLDLSYSSQITDHGLMELKNLQNLTSLTLFRCDGITDLGLSHLNELKNLTSLALIDFSQIKDKVLKKLKHLTNLSSLNLNSTCYKQITDHSLSKLKKLNLTSLRLDGCKLITDQGLKVLKSLQNLTSLSLERCELITDQGLKVYKILLS